MWHIERRSDLTWLVEQIWERERERDCKERQLNSPCEIAALYVEKLRLMQQTILDALYTFKMATPMDSTKSQPNSPLIDDLEGSFLVSILIFTVRLLVYIMFN